MTEDVVVLCGECLWAGRGEHTPVAIAGCFIDGIRWANQVCPVCGTTVSTFIDMGRLDLDALRAAGGQDLDFEMFAL